MEVFYVVLITALALFFDFSNGFHDAANQVATIIASRTLTPTISLFIAALADFIGAYFLGTNVAATIGKEIVDPQVVSPENAHYILLAALGGAIIWNLITWYFGIPSSSSHALIGALSGTFIAGFGSTYVNINALIKIYIVMLLSPVVGLLLTYITTMIVVKLTKDLKPSINNLFKNAQILTLITQGLAHGTNDAQKTMGVIAFSVVIYGLYKPEAKEFTIPHWIILSCSIAIAAGTFTGGWRIIRTIGRGLYKIKKIHSFCSQVCSSLTIYAASYFGFPISTTQVINSSILGSGAYFRFKMVKWQVAFDMLIAWIITIPVSGGIAVILYYIIRRLF